MEESSVFKSRLAASYGYASDATLDDFSKQKLVENAGNFWHQFYQRNSNHFFKDRHYLMKEFPCLLSEKELLICELGKLETEVFFFFAQHPLLRMWCG